jgi:hypothetical protein
MDISNSATNSREYNTNLGLSNKELREKVAKSNRGTIILKGEITGGLEAHTFNCNISLKTTTLGKKGKGNDEETTSGKTLTGNSYMTTGGTPTTSTN